MPITEITSVQEFEDILFDKINHEKKYIFCDFFASWCGPCKRIFPTIKEYSEEYNQNVYYIKINVDDLPSISQEYNVRQLPTFAILETGERKTNHQFIIGTNKDKIKQKLKSLENQGVTRNNDF